MLLTSLEEIGNGSRALSDAMTSAHGGIDELRQQQLRDQVEAFRIVQNAADLQRQLDEQQAQRAVMMEAGRRLCEEHLEKDKLWHEAKQEHRELYESCEAKA